MGIQKARTDRAAGRSLFSTLFNVAASGVQITTDIVVNLAYSGGGCMSSIPFAPLFSASRTSVAILSSSRPVETQSLLPVLVPSMRDPTPVTRVVSAEVFGLSICTRLITVSVTRMRVAD
jgi:hypothetical protein